MNERALIFDCEGARLVGILSEPSAPTEVALVNIVGGPQYRAGSHRQFVHLARTLAENGIAALRFDARGMGDSDGEQRSFEDIQTDVAAAIDALCAALPSVRQVVLSGLCGGASAALLYWHATRDARVRGMVLINPWVRSDATLARTRVKHYYLQRMMEGAFWRKLLSGQVAKSAVTELLSSLKLAVATSGAPRDAAEARAMDLSHRMAAAVADFGQAVLLVLSEDDYTAKEFLETVALQSDWQSCLAASTVTRFDVKGADHTYSHPGMRQIVESAVLEWFRAQKRAR
jgi:exosortase A-associated hydrolase 1